MAVNLQNVARTIAEMGFLSAVLGNSLLIYLTGWHTQNITGTYKHMIIIFALLGLSFSCTEMLARPFVHNYNGAFVYFSLSKEITQMRSFTLILLVVYAGAYAALISFVAVQFIYRYLVLVNAERLSQLFDGWKLIFWIFYTIFFGFVWSALVYFCGIPDAYSTGYIRQEIEDVYGMDIDKSAVFIIVAYEKNSFSGNLETRWSSVIFTFGTMAILIIQYAVMVYCGTSMHFQMNEKLKNFSVAHQRLQKQFFKTLVLQITVPTILFHMPIFPVLLAPFFNFQLSFQSGIIYSLFSLYPPIDGLIIMSVVSEYRNALSSLLDRQPATATVSTMRPTMDTSVRMI